ncbi:hypothetical protein WDZ11_22165 (plasmid) [Roseomonas mucosa]|uniref:hypothetical protein n=1 Tax=Roseomonas mucosa TaxID=207340 RepID=UPI0030CED1CB
MELVVARQNLDDASLGLAEGDEVPQQVQKAPLLEHTVQHGLEFGRALRRHVLTVHRSPRHEPLPIRRKGADPRRHAIRDDQGGISAEQGGDLRLVGLKLVVGAVQRGVLGAGVLEFQHR